MKDCRKYNEVSYSVVDALCLIEIETFYGHINYMRIVS